MNELIKTAKVPYVANSSSLTNFFEEKFLSEIFICFDDIERKGEALSLKSFLGLVNYLGEEKNCKIVAIFNESQLSKDDQTELKKYREKIVHLEVAFAPSVQNNFKLIFNDDQVSLLEIFKSLNCNNIRVMQRVKWNLDFFKGYYYSQKYLKEAFEKKIAILTCLYYSFSDQMEMDNLSKFYYTFYLKRDSDEIKAKFNLLDRAGYSPEDFDDLILKFLKDGYCNEEAIKNTLDAVNQKYLHANISEKNRTMWNLYHSNFKLTQSEYLKKHLDFIKKHLEELSLYDVIMALDFFKKLDGSVDTSELIDKSIDRVICPETKLNDLHLNRLPFSEEIKGKILKNFYQKHQEVCTIREVLNRFSGDSFNGVDDVLLLEKFSGEDFYNWLISNESSYLLDSLKKFFIMFGNEKNEKVAGVVEKIRKALDIIARRSELDRLRVGDIVGLQLSENETDN